MQARNNNSLSKKIKCKISSRMHVGGLCLVRLQQVNDKMFDTLKISRLVNVYLVLDT